MRCSREDLSGARELFEAHAVEMSVSELLLRFDGVPTSGNAALCCRVLPRNCLRGARNVDRRLIAARFGATVVGLRLRRLAYRTWRRRLRCRLRTRIWRGSRRAGIAGHAGRRRGVRCGRPRSALRRNRCGCRHLRARMHWRVHARGRVCTQRRVLIAGRACEHRWWCRDDARRRAGNRLQESSAALQVVYARAQRGRASATAGTVARFPAVAGA